MIEPTLLLSLGEPAGIGPELTSKIWTERKENKVSPFVYAAPLDFVRTRAERLGLNVPLQKWVPGETALSDLFRDALPILDFNLPVSDQPGTINTNNSAAVVEAIRLSVELIKAGKAHALVTNPINKKALYEVGFDHPGHTEYLGELAKLFDNHTYRPIMMLAGPELRTVPATLHIPLSEVPSALDENQICELIEITASELKKRFQIKNPRLVVAGLNPHAGEGGTMGREDDEIIQPAVEKAQKAGIDVTGPLPADTLFHAAKRSTYDAAIAMYHDQALLPVKTIAFDKTVNVTLGLPFIRTSPDHGTALDIAGKMIARPDSLLAAISMADQMARAEMNTQHESD